MSRAVILLVAAIASTAAAYDSQCSRADGSACESGPDAGHNRWLGPSAEHEIIWEHTRPLAGLPASVSAPVQLDVFTGSATVPTAAGALPTLTPAPFAAATRVRRRELTIGELAQLPDFSFALWDWALGNETCPLGDGADAITCHDFRTHMGPVNSNHFLPQARTFYAHYHALALGRGEACRQLADAVGAQAARFRPILEACEDEALMLEAVGHHYLQDAWSMGHMWERWGSPDPAAFPDPVAAIAVAMASGLIHGARGVLEHYISSPLSPFRDVPDALCAPAPGVQWRAPGMLAPALGLGDLYYPRLTDPSEPFGEQAARLFSCAAAGMREVYAAAGQQHGPMEPLDPSLRPLDPLSDDCFAQRATNLAMWTGAALDVIENDGTPYRIVLDGDFATMMVIAGAEGGLPSDARQEQYRLDMANALFRIQVGAEVDPDGVQAASGALPPLLGVRPNGAYVTSPPAPYTDPALPWSGADARTAALVRTFHRAHAEDLCRAMGRGDGEPVELDALRDRAKSRLPPDEHAAALAACAELAARHLRFGKDETDYDTAHEPLCAFVPGTTEYAYTGEEGDVGPGDFAGTRDAAESWCVATTTTTTTSSTTTTLPLGAHVRLVEGSNNYLYGAADVSLRDEPRYHGDSHEGYASVLTFPYSGSLTYSAADSAGPPHDASGSSDVRISLTSDITLDEDGNLVEATGSGAASGHAALSGLPEEMFYDGSWASGQAQLAVNFEVVGTPVAFRVETTVSGTGLVPHGNGGAYTGIMGYTGGRWAADDGLRAPGHYLHTGTLLPGLYSFGALASVGIGNYPDEAYAVATAGGFQTTLTLGPSAGSGEWDDHEIP
jgi:hypothetical protein